MKDLLNSIKQEFKDGYQFGDIGSAIAKNLGSRFGSAVGALENSKLNADIETQKYISENQPSWNMTGLQNAGLNPALAAGGNLTSSPTAPAIDTSMFGSAFSLLGKILNTTLQGAFRLGNSAVGVAAKAAAAA